MSRLIDADALISDLEYDVKMDEGSLIYEDLTSENREIIQFDKDCKQNAIDLLRHAPTIEERKTGQLSNKEWIDFLVAQFDISRTSARDMLHVMMQVKREDNFKNQFSQRNGCLVKDLVKEDGGGA